MTSMLEAALRYAKRGWPVFPLAPRSKQPMRGSSGLLEATTDRERIERWWTRDPDANVALATGPASGVWVLDVDGPEGSRTLTELEEELGPLPDTLEQQTGGGGRQLFFAWPVGREIRNRQNAGLDGWEKTRKTGIDVRGEGGYVVLPPSIHPDTGHAYDWQVGDSGRIDHAHKAWLDWLSPVSRYVPPWEKVAPVPQPKVTAQGPVIERARLYLDECDAAIQGAGGHNALLWAARAMVVGFQLSDEQALQLLWGHYNPRCVPPWDREDKSECKDFERKVSQARATPCEKAPGWLLDEYGLRSAEDSLRAIARGTELARGLLASQVERAKAAEVEVEPEEPARELAPDPRNPFPLELFPEKVRDYVEQVAEAHQVDASFVALPVLAAAGAAMGNCWRYELKRGYVHPPTLWVMVVGRSGSNKSGPLREVTAPLREPVPAAEIEVAGALRNPQGELCLGNATLEAVVARLHESPRGLLLFQDELAGWVNSMGAYKSGKGGGGDEQAWLEFHGAGPYSVDRKTNNERIRIPAASVAVLGGIQPKVLAKAFGPANFDSGLVPRFLIACPPRRAIYWTDAVVDELATEHWREVIRWLRTRPFAQIDTTRSRLVPWKCKPSREAVAIYADYHNTAGALAAEEGRADSEAAFLTKSQTNAARLTLIHHGLVNACEGGDMRLEVQRESAEAGVEWARWCLNEQLSVYSYTTRVSTEEAGRYLASRIYKKHGTGEVTRSGVTRLNSRRWPTTAAAHAAMVQLVELGWARWTDTAQDRLALLEGIGE